MTQGCFVRNFVPLLCIAFLPASSPLHRTIIHGLGGACKWAMLGNYSFHAFSRGFVDVFLWGVLCSTLPTWNASGEFTGYLSLVVYVASAAAIEVHPPAPHATLNPNVTLSPKRQLCAPR
jgi:hypothetical protein